MPPHDFKVGRFMNCFGSRSYRHNSFSSCLKPLSIVWPAAWSDNKIHLSIAIFYFFRYNYYIDLYKRNCVIYMTCNISNENFKDAWAYLDRKRRWAKKLYYARQVAEFFTQGVFFVIFIAFAFSALTQFGGKTVLDFLNKFPDVMTKWKQFASYFQISLSWQFFLVTVLKIYAVCIALAAPFTAVVLLLYYPKKKEVPSQPELYHDALVLAYRDYSRYHNRFSGNMRNFASVFFGVSAFAFTTGFLMHCATMRKYHAFLEEYASKVNLAACCGALLLIAAYLILTLPIYWLVRYGLRSYLSRGFRSGLEQFICGC